MKVGKLTLYNNRNLKVGDFFTGVFNFTNINATELRYVITEICANNIYFKDIYSGEYDSMHLLSYNASQCRLLLYKNRETQINKLLD